MAEGRLIVVKRRRKKKDKMWLCCKSVPNFRLFSRSLILLNGKKGEQGVHPSN